ncbi:hypothetical protein [Borrelia hermsii]|uniref:Uncharacterized protein n=3 Tax=Borrelia hermsii TaxID=140 RepID=A0AAN0X5X5_BORHE|nr:hypothetical protein [Borrelia hermsii]AAX16680.1 hypothetical protein BH0163 [Borrelia hermsii DAH]AJW72982.1 hypothetical protein L283_00775 [Borrelia hermsii CC1]AMR75662.1 hypothetical protein A0V01_03545 [Borrelia hermsii]ANA42979.1 hypothetical protein AXX13_00780 [Borrelia hermsii HS1]UCP01194.1 hypothetical protein K9R62_00790 [Borrelia hermsii]
MKKLPEIFYLNDKELDILISQIGISSDAQKMILRIILEHNQNVINYANFIEDYSVKIRALKGELDFLFRKLYEVKRGIIVNQATSNGELMPYKIIITDENSYDFYYYAIEDLFLKHYAGIELFSTLLTVRNIDKNLLAFEKEFVILSNSDVNLKYFQDNASLKKIFVLNSLIIPSGQALYFVEFMKRILFGIASNRIVKDVFMRAKNLKLSEYDRILDEGINGVGVAYNLLLGILENKDEILNKKGVNISKHYFTFLEILNIYIVNEKSLEESRNLESIKIDETLKSIEKAIEFKPGFINIEEFKNILQEHSGGLSDPEHFLKIANEYFFESNINTSLPKIFSIKHGMYLYKPCAYSMFLKEFDQILVDIRDRLKNEFTRMLSNGKNSSTILTEEGLEKTLIEFIANYDINNYCLKNKAVFLDFIVSHYRRVSKTQNIQTHLKDIIKTEAAKYFKNSNTFLPLYRIYKVDLSKILNSAYRDLPLLKRLLLFLTGKQQSYKEALSRLNSKPMAKDHAGLFDPGERVKRQLDKRRKQREELREQIRNSYAKKGKGASKGQALSRTYTKSEQDEAWMKFEDKLNKK